MPKGHLDRVLRQIRTWIGGQGPDEATDGQLLERFHCGRDQAAFRILVERHGPMVLRACRRVLTDPNDAEDVFQAAFLVLVRKAGSLDGSRSLANWLYTVAYRLAVNLKAQSARRQAHERQVSDMPQATTTDESWNELRLVLDEELNRLPEKYREPLVLCYLQGKTNEQAAQELGCPVGSMSWRLGQARELLRKRLGRRGVELASGTLFTLLAQDALAATMPAALVDTTVHAATWFAEGGTVAAGVVSAQAATLTEGMLKAMFMTRLKIAAVLLLTVGLVGAGAGVLTHQALAGRATASADVQRAPQGPDVAEANAPLEVADKPKAKEAAAEKDKNQFDLAGVVVAAAADGKTFTLQIPSTKDADDLKVEIKITDKTTATYFNVALDGAKPTVGYRAGVDLVKGSTDTAARISFAHKDQAPDVTGLVAAVARDGQSFTVDVPAKVKGEAAQVRTIKLAGRTVATYFGVAPGGARPTEGHVVQVWLIDGDKETAARAVFGTGKKDPSVGKPDRMGIVSARSADGKRVTLEVRAKNKGEAPEMFEIQVTDQTRIIFDGVGPDAAKPTERDSALVWLEAGSKDVAARISFSPIAKEKQADVSGRVVAVLDKGQRFTLEVPRKKGEEGQRVDVQITDQTHLSFHGVGTNGARLTDGYHAQVLFAAGSKTVAAEVRVEGPMTEKRPDGGKKPEEKPKDGKAPEGEKAKPAPDGNKDKPADDGKGKPAKGAEDGKAKPAKEDDGKGKPAKGAEDGKKPEEKPKAPEGEKVKPAPDANKDKPADANKDKPADDGKGKPAPDANKPAEKPKDGKAPEGEKAKPAPEGNKDKPADDGKGKSAPNNDGGKDKPAKGAEDGKAKPVKGADDGKKPEEKPKAPEAEKVKPAPDGNKEKPADDGKAKPAKAGDDGKGKPADDGKGKPAKGADDGKAKPAKEADDGKAKPAKGAEDGKGKPAPDGNKPEEKPKAPESEKGKPAPEGNKPADDGKGKPAPNGKNPEEKPKDGKAPEGEKAKPAPDGNKEKPADDGKGKPAKPGDDGKPAAGKPTNPGKHVQALSDRDPLPIAAAIDRELDKRLTEAGVPASPQADDAEFLRRVTLDITGRIPTLDKAKSFLDSRDPDKRRKVIDELLTTPDCGQHFATVWRNLIAPRNPINAKQQVETFSSWLADQFHQNRGWDQIVYELLTVEGEVNRTPQAAFIMANSENGQPQPNLLTASAARLFLGVQLQCAECHNHPFASWKQADFWAVAAFFGRVGNGGGKGAAFALTEATNAAQPEGKKGEQGRPRSAPGGAIVIPASGGKGAGQVVRAKFLDGETPALDAQQPLRPQLAAWMTAPENKFFAPALVNRTWAQFFGRGFVNPVDAFYQDQAPSHPVLLQLLADEFSASGHDLKHLVRCLCNSQAYQRTSRPQGGNETDEKLFSHMAVKTLSPESFFDSLALVMSGTRRGKDALLSSQQQFLDAFRTQGELTDAGGFSHGIPQFLRRMNSEAFNAGSPLIDRLVASQTSREQVIESLYLATLSRQPTADETRLMVDYLAKRNNPGQGYAGVLWILLNSGEFVLNH